MHFSNKTAFVVATRQPIDEITRYADVRIELFMSVSHSISVRQPVCEY